MGAQLTAATLSSSSGGCDSSLDAAREEALKRSRSALPAVASADARCRIGAHRRGSGRVEKVEKVNPVLPPSSGKTLLEPQRDRLVDVDAEVDASLKYADTVEMSGRPALLAHPLAETGRELRQFLLTADLQPLGPLGVAYQGEIELQATGAPRIFAKLPPVTGLRRLGDHPGDRSAIDRSQRLAQMYLHSARGSDLLLTSSARLGPAIAPKRRTAARSLFRGTVRKLYAPLRSARTFALKGSLIATRALAVDALRGQLLRGQVLRRETFRRRGGRLEDHHDVAHLLDLGARLLFPISACGLAGEAEDPESPGEERKTAPMKPSMKPPEEALKASYVPSLAPPQT